MGIIRGDGKNKHLITAFQFGDLDAKNSDIEEEGFEPLAINTVSEPPKDFGVIPHQMNSVETVEDSSRRDSMISSLLEKSDSLSNSLMAVQKQLTEQESLFKNEMTDAKERSYEQGLKDGISQAKIEMDNLYSSELNQLANSISGLEKLSEQVSSMMNTIEKELVHTSVAIAKEVIDSEISFNSGQVAINLAQSLIKKLDDAKEIKVRVNMNDYESVKVSLSNLEHIEIIPDSAVTKGGAIIISDVGSIEGNIMERYKQVKSHSILKIDG